MNTKALKILPLFLFIFCLPAIALSLARHSRFGGGAAEAGFLVFNSVQAAAPLNVVINEIAWMGSKIEGVESKNWGRYEWLELYNTTEQEIDISGWKLENAKAKKETLIIPVGKIKPESYFLICQKEIGNCDLIESKLSLHNEYNKNGKLILKAPAENLIDAAPEANKPKWPGGDNETKQTMERKNPQSPGSDSLNWQTSRNPGGTPRAKNSLVVQIEDATQIVEEKIKPKPQPIVYPSGVVINEILPSPEGPDDQEEWIELKNLNAQEVGLSQWKIRDTTGSITTYTLPEGTKIGPQGFLVLSRPTTKITLNNGEDGLLLIQPNGNILDTVNYKKASKGQSYNLTLLENNSLTGQAESGWVWSARLTPGSENIIPLSTLETKTKSSKETATQKQLAAIGEQIPKSSKSLYIFLIALALAIFSGVIILFLKKKLKRPIAE